jgi:hypothetical protein
MHAALLLALVAAAQDELPPLKLATGHFTYVGIKDEMRDFVPEHLASRMRTVGVVVVTPAEVATLLGRERQRQLMGCETGAEKCDAELLGALGVDGVIIGELAAVGDLLQLNLKVVSESGKSLGAWTRRVEGLNHLLDALDEGALAVAEQVLISTGRKQAPAPKVASARDWWWLPAVAGLAVGAGGGVLLVFSKADHDRLTTPQSPLLAPADARKLSSDGALFQTLGFVGIGVGSAAVLAGAGLLLFGAPPPVTPSISVGAQGAALSLGGTFP